MISPQYVDGLELRIKELTAERDALAAHVERYHAAYVKLTNAEQTEDADTREVMYLANQELMAQFDDIAGDSPKDSIARIKPQWQAEALLDLHEHWRGNGTMRVGALLDKAIELQEEAEGGET